MSTTKTISRFNGRKPKVRTSARASPATSPVATTSTASSTVSTKPPATAGRLRAITGTFRNVSANPVMRRSVLADPADEGAGARMRRGTEYCAGDPDSSTLPSAMKTTRSAAARAKLSSWLTPSGDGGGRFDAEQGSTNDAPCRAFLSSGRAAL
jgi:hypothetical protein